MAAKKARSVVLCLWLLASGPGARRALAAATLAAGAPAAATALTGGPAWRVDNLPARNAFKSELKVHLDTLGGLLSTQKLGPAIQYVYTDLKPQVADADRLAARQVIARVLADPKALSALALKLPGGTYNPLIDFTQRLEAAPEKERQRFRAALDRLIPSMTHASLDELNGKLGGLFDGSPNHIAPVGLNDTADAALKQTIEAGRFIIGRGLDDYYNNLGKEFARDLHALPESGYWLDGGAGIGAAAADYKDQGGAARVTAISFAESKSKNAKFKHLTGRHFEDIPLEEIGQVDLISDVFGIISYTPDPSAVLAKYLKLLKPGGAMYLYLLGAYHGGLVKFPDGEERTLSDWLATIPGLEVAGRGRLRITRKPGRSVEIPRLELVDLHDAAPPLRFFKQTEEVLVVE